jgi:phosphohistidine phosphatase SixA
MLRHRRWLLVPVVALVLPMWAPAAEGSEEFWAGLKKSSRIVLMRHSHAPGDPPDKDLDNLKNCKTQRNLDEAGRAQARRTGDEFRKRGFKQARIFSSQYCRSLETGRLLKLGPVTELPILNQLFYAQLIALREASEKVRQFMKAQSGKEPALLVSHVSNIQALAGVQLDSGEAAAVHLTPSGDVVVAGRLLIK